jgi:hypothetical protein
MRRHRDRLVAMDARIPRSKHDTPFGGVTEAAVASLRPAHPGEYDVLGAAWPEMAAFLASHGLG